MSLVIPHNTLISSGLTAYGPFEMLTPKPSELLTTEVATRDGFSLFADHFEHIREKPEDFSGLHNAVKIELGSFIKLGAASTITSLFNAQGVIFKEYLLKAAPDRADLREAISEARRDLEEYKSAISHLFEESVLTQAKVAEEACSLSPNKCVESIDKSLIEKVEDAFKDTYKVAEKNEKLKESLQKLYSLGGLTPYQPFEKLTTEVIEQDRLSLFVRDRFSLPTRDSFNQFAERFERDGFSLFPEHFERIRETPEAFSNFHKAIKMELSSFIRLGAISKMTSLFSEQGMIYDEFLRKVGPERIDLKEAIREARRDLNEYKSAISHQFEESVLAQAMVAEEACSLSPSQYDESSIEKTANAVKDTYSKCVKSIDKSFIEKVKDAVKDTYKVSEKYGNLKTSLQKLRLLKSKKE